MLVVAHKDSYFVRKVSTFAQKLGSGQLYLYILYIRAPGLAGVEGAVEKSENVKWSKSVPKEKSAKKCAKFFKKDLVVSKKSLPLHPQMRQNEAARLSGESKAKKSSKKFGG